MQEEMCFSHRHFKLPTKYDTLVHSLEFIQDEPPLSHCSQNLCYGPVSNYKHKQQTPHIVTFTQWVSSMEVNQWPECLNSELQVQTACKNGQPLLGVEPVLLNTVLKDLTSYPLP
jgi:hypothetical protein